MARQIRKYVGDNAYAAPGVLVAFSGSLAYDGEETTEPKENGGLAESALPKAFAYTRKDDKAVRTGRRATQREYRILVVAEKYQTGFDPPLLTTMYVNKKLAGISAVQTLLSRLNRTADRESQANLAVLDFVNDAEDIKESFRPYFEEANTLPSDPNLLYTAQSQVMQPDILVEEEMREFADAYLEAEEKAAGPAAREDELRTDHKEQLTIPVGGHLGAKLTIEHVMPQSWRENWPPLDDDPSEGADRDELVHTLGNLTLVTARLNPALGNMAWDDKRRWLSEHSLLRLTHGTLLNPPPTVQSDDWASAWNEYRVHTRGAHLASLALNIWPSADQLLAAPVLSGLDAQ